ncbi:MAG: hypothetical protein AAGH70_09155 [Pseudomonadota bacterium]
MKRLITTPMMEVEWINAVWMWRIRVLTQTCFAAFSIVLLVLSLARLLGVEIANWPLIALWIMENFGRFIIWLLSVLAEFVQAIGLVRLASWIRNCPVWPFDLLTAYLLVGSLVRLAEIWIVLSVEKETLDLGPDFIRDQWAQTSHKQRVWMAWETSRKYLFWPGRVLSDLKDRHYSLSPAIGGGLFLLTLALLGIASAIFS